MQNDTCSVDTAMHWNGLQNTCNQMELDRRCNAWYSYTTVIDGMVTNGYGKHC